MPSIHRLGPSNLMQELIRFSDIMKLSVTKVKGGWIKNFLLESRSILSTFLCQGTKVGLEKKT